MLVLEQKISRRIGFLGRSRKGPCAGSRINETIRYTVLYLTDPTYNGQ